MNDGTLPTSDGTPRDSRGNERRCYANNRWNAALSIALAVLLPTGLFGVAIRHQFEPLHKNGSDKIHPQKNHVTNGSSSLSGTHAAALDYIALPVGLSTRTPFGPGTKKKIRVLDLSRDASPVISLQTMGITHKKTTYMPIWYIGQALESLRILTNWNGEEWDISRTNPHALGWGGRVHGKKAIVVNGHLSSVVPSLVYQHTTYLPIWYIMKALKTLGVTSHWNGVTWQVTQHKNAQKSAATSGSTPSKGRSTSATVPKTTGALTSSTKTSPTKASQTSKSTSGSIARPQILGFVTSYGGSQTSLDDLRNHASLVTEMATFTHSIGANGTVVGTTDLAALQTGKKLGLGVYATVNNAGQAGFDGALVSQILSRKSETDNLLNHLVGLATEGGYTGINLDFEMLPSSVRSEYSSFVSELANRLHSKGKQLSVDVPGMTVDRGAFDQAAIGKAADTVVVMAYDYSYPGGPPGPIAPVDWVSQVLAFTTSRVPSDKVMLGVPAYGYDWGPGNRTKALTLGEIDTVLKARHLSPEWNSAAQEPYYTYVQSGAKHTVYYENSESIARLLQLATDHRLQGISIWHMDTEDAAFWDPLTTWGRRTAGAGARP